MNANNDEKISSKCLLSLAGSFKEKTTQKIKLAIFFPPFDFIKKEKKNLN
jgi:hypothetical protein